MSQDGAAPQITLVSTEKLFPKTVVGDVKRVRLSWIDSSVARYPPTSAVWLYDKAAVDLDIERLKSSFIDVLDWYPQWSGQLEWWDQLGGSLALKFGDNNDPGIIFNVASCDRNLVDLYPSKEDRTKTPIWATNDVSLTSVTDDKLALNTALNAMDDFLGLSVVIIQVTTFTCGGVAVGVKMVHPLADAKGLITFVKHWSLFYRNEQHTVAAPVFDPSIINQLANEQEHDEKLIEKAKALPQLSYDVWASGSDHDPTCPNWMITHAPAAGTYKEPLGEKIPWSTLSMAPSRAVMIQFTKERIEQIYAAANQSQISYLDALVAYLWSNLIKSRGFTENKQVQLGMLVGLRQRFDPPLPEGFTGSPVTVASVLVNSSEADELSKIAQSIRKSLTEFNSKNMPALVHKVAHSDSPQRYLNAFFGSEHTIMTAWIRDGAHDIAFVPGQLPWFVEACMLRTDGIVQVMEAAPVESSGHWHQAGALVYICLENDVMDTFVKLVQPQ